MKRIYNEKNCKHVFFFFQIRMFVPVLLLVFFGPGPLFTFGLEAQTTGVEQPKEANNEQIKTALIESYHYFDIRNGFSIQPPTDCHLYSRLPDNSLSIFSLAPWSNMEKWEVIKLSASKPIIHFIKANECYLTVSILVGRQQTSLEDMLQFRIAYWKKFPDQARLQQSQTTIINDHKAAVLTLTWNETDAEQNGHIIRETLIQNDEDRYFLLDLITPDGTAEERTASESLMKTVSESFHCIGKSTANQQWNSAVANSRNLLEKLTFAQLNKSVRAKQWYIITQNDKQRGYLTVSEKAFVDKEQNQFSVEIYGFMQTHESAMALTRILGWIPIIPASNGNSQSGNGSIRLEGQYTYTVNLKSETFQYNIIPQSNTQKGYFEETQWHDKVLTTLRHEVPQNGHKVIEEKLEVKPGLYLPWSVEQVVWRLIERTQQRDYAFMSYHNNALGYDVYRIVQPYSTKGNSDQPERPTYIINQAGTLGPIVETWLDENGRVIRQQSEGLTISRADKTTVQKIFPEAQ